MTIAACLAISTGLCSGSDSTPVAIPMVDVAAAAKLRAIMGCELTTTKLLAAPPVRSACRRPVRACDAELQKCSKSAS